MKTVYVTGALLSDKEDFLHRHAQDFLGDHYFRFGSTRFTSTFLDQPDGVLVLNTPDECFSVVTNPEKVVAFMQEPGYALLNPWMSKENSVYSHIFSPTSVKFEPSHGFLGWSVMESYLQLKESSPEKTKHCSCIASSLRLLRGHRKRDSFVHQIAHSSLPIDIYGKGRNFIENKSDGISPYRYSIVLENSSFPHYFTEKLVDCFVNETVPIYYGCTNLESYFPNNSFIALSIDHPQEALKQIEFILKHDDYASRRPSLIEAKSLCLNYYNPLSKMNEIMENGNGEKKQEIVIQPQLPSKWIKGSAVALDKFGFNLRFFSSND